MITVLTHEIITSLLNTSKHYRHILRLWEIRWPWTIWSEVLNKHPWCWCFPAAEIINIFDKHYILNLQGIIWIIISGGFSFSVATFSSHITRLVLCFEINVNCAYLCMLAQNISKLSSCIGSLGATYGPQNKLIKNWCSHVKILHLQNVIISETSLFWLDETVCFWLYYSKDSERHFMSFMC